MKSPLGRRWLSELLEAAEGLPAEGLAWPAPLNAQAEAPLRTARRRLGHALADLGLLHGAPLPPALEPQLPARADDEARAEAQRDRLFLATFTALMRLTQGLAEPLGLAPARRLRLLRAALVALAGDDAGALELADEKTSAKRSDALLLEAGVALGERRSALTTQPVLGIPLHAGLSWSLAFSFGRLFLTLALPAGARRSALARRRSQGHRDTALLVEALVQLAWAPGRPADEVRGAIAGQISRLGLPRRFARELRERLDRPTTPRQLAQRLRGREHRRFVVTQALLAALVDGRRSERERAWLMRLGAALGFTPAEVDALEHGLAAFYAQHRELVDTFAPAEPVLERAEELVDEMSHQLRKQLGAVVQEVKQTGELAELLARAAAGRTLDDRERAALRRDALDLAKAVPSLALLAAPGGLLMLGALTRVLPFELRPSAFVDPTEPPPDEERGA